MDKSSQNGGNQLFNGDVSDNNNSVAYQTSLSSSHTMMNEKDTSKASPCTDAPDGTSGNNINISYLYFAKLYILLK